MESNTSENSNFDSLEKSNSLNILKDPELRKMDRSSDEYKTAVEQKFNKTATESVTEEPEKVNLDKTDTDEKELPVSNNIQKRFDKLTKQRQEAREETERLRKELEEFKTQNVKVVQPTQPVVQNDSDGFSTTKPNLGDYATLFEYNEALTDWKLDKREYEKEVKVKQNSVKESFEATLNTFYSKGTEVEKELKLSPGEFNILVNAEDFKLYESTRQAFLDSEYGAKIAYDIASDDSLKEAFSNMSAIKQIAYIGKLEAKYESVPVKSTQKLTNAKKPDAKLPKGNANISQTASSFQDLKALRNQRRLAAGKKID